MSGGFWLKTRRLFALSTHYIRYGCSRLFTEAHACDFRRHEHPYARLSTHIAWLPSPTTLPSTRPCLLLTACILPAHLQSAQLCPVMEGAIPLRPPCLRMSVAPHLQLHGRPIYRCAPWADPAYPVSMQLPRGEARADLGRRAWTDRRA
jgi:hypothetical protein